MLRLTLFQSRFRQRGRTADTVKAGQVLAHLDTTLASADKAGVASDLASQQMQERRIVAELADQPMMSKAGYASLRYKVSTSPTAEPIWMVWIRKGRISDQSLA